MNREEHRKYLRYFVDFSKKKESSRREALAFLVRAGISNDSGKLKSCYKK